MADSLVLPLLCAISAAITNRAPDAASFTVECPRPYTVFQRTAPDAGTIVVRGVAPRDVAVEAQFGAGQWHPLTTNGDTFQGTIEGVTPGCGALAVRIRGEPSTTVTIDPIGVGDIFVVTGQSNAAGQGTTLQRSARTATWFAAAFREDPAGWTPADDPMTPLDRGSPWPLVANALAERAGVPLGFITVTDSSRSVLAWAPGASTHARVVEQIHAATFGAMRVKAVLWFQGEADMRRSEPAAPTVDGDRAAYLAALTTFADDLVSRTGAEAIVVGQSNVNILNDASLGARGIDNIRAAQESAWWSHPRIRFGPVTYDISLGDPRTPGEDFVHFVTDSEIATLAARWAAAVDFHFYGGVDGLGPRLSAIRRLDDTRFELRFVDVHLPLTGAAPFGGFAVRSGDTQYAYDLTVTLLPSGDALLITCPAPLAPDATVSLGSNSLAWFANVVRDSSPSSLPPVPFFDLRIDNVDFDVEQR
jgi:Carbohydrate esterase, sialic acid-specific acetylesterase